jgi:hypothetical protein
MTYGLAQIVQGERGVALLKKLYENFEQRAFKVECSGSKKVKQIFKNHG